jgi:hypothetical protein
LVVCDVLNEPRPFALLARNFDASVVPMGECILLNASHFELKRFEARTGVEPIYTTLQAAAVLTIQQGLPPEAEAEPSPLRI